MSWSRKRMGDGHGPSLLRSARGGAVLLLAMAAFQCASCDDLSYFTTTADEIYSGEVLAGDQLLAGFEPGSRMQLVFDIDMVSEGPGSITVAPPDSGAETIFDDAPLLPVAALKYDSLGGLDFPSGRLRNYLFLCPAGGDRSGKDAIVIVSLMSGGDVEVRVMLGTDDLYGVFLLEKTRL